MNRDFNKTFSKGYVDNLNQSLNNISYVRNKMKRNDALKAYDDSHRYLIRYDIDKQRGKIGNMYPAYNRYINGQPSSVLLQPPSQKSIVYNQGFINGTTKYTDSVTKEFKVVSGYLIPQEEIRINEIKSKYLPKVAGII